MVGGRWVVAVWAVAGWAVAVWAVAGWGAGPSTAGAATARAPRGTATDASTSGNVVWLCRPGRASDPCTSGLTTTVVRASGATATQRATDVPSSPYDCFYVYPTVSSEKSTNANLRVQQAEIATAEAQASRFSTVCRVWAPMYRQVTLATLAAHPTLDVPAAATATAYDSLRRAFTTFLARDDHDRPIVFIGHSQGAAMLIKLLRQYVDDDPSLRSRLVLAIILGGNVEVRTGSRTGGSFRHIPVCDAAGQHGCVIAYSTFPGVPPPGSLFGRPGTGVSLQSGQTATSGLQVACVNPAAMGGGTADLRPYFPSEGAAPTPWVTYPGLYVAHCAHGDGATWLDVAKASPASDHRTVVTEQDGPDWGYHVDDVNLALGDLVQDVADAERSWKLGDGR